MRFAVAGLGSAGRRHADNLVALGHEVVAYDPDKGRDWSGEREPSLEAALDRAEAAVIASPSSLHGAQALAALGAGCHALVEKPLATDAGEAERVAAAAGAAGLVCGVAMNLRFHPGVERIRALVGSGQLGTPYVAEAAIGYALPLWRPGTDYRRSYSARAELGGGILWDAIHELDYLLWILGPVESVIAEESRVSDLEIDVEDTVCAVLRFASGALGTVTLNFVEAAYRRGCLVAGSRATARWDWASSTVTVRREGEADAVEELDYDPKHGYRTELEDFAAAFAAGRAPRTGVEEGVQAVRLAEAIRRSATEGRRIDVPG